MKNKGFRTIKRIGNKYQLKVCNKYFDYELKIPSNRFSQMQKIFETWHNHIVDMYKVTESIWEEVMNEEW